MGCLSFGPIEKYNVFCDLSVREKDTRAASQAFERMHNTLSHRVKTEVPGGTHTHPLDVPELCGMHYSVLSAMVDESVCAVFDSAAGALVVFCAALLRTHACVCLVCVLCLPRVSLRVL